MIELHKLRERFAEADEDEGDRKRAEDTVRKRENILYATERMAKVGGWEVNAQTLEVLWTEEKCRIHGVLLGYKPTLEEVINFLHPEERENLTSGIYA
jgi:hypothetical protein